MQPEQQKPQAQPQPQQTHWQHTPSYQPVPPLYGDAPRPEPQHIPQPQHIDPETERKHKESKAKYPQLRLSNHEFVVLEVRRHPIGLVSIWAIVGLIVVAVLALLPLYSLNLSSIASAFLVEESSLPSAAALALPIIALILLFLLGGYIATYVYQNNRFYLTNESVIQVIQLSLFSKKEQHINLANIEDASYRQQGIIQHMFGYGALRLSTEGDETTYRFHFVADPQRVVGEVIEAMENATGNAARFRGDGQPPIPVGKH